MALIFEGLTFFHQFLYGRLHRVTEKRDNPLKVGVLSTATINIGGIIKPTETHPDVLLWGIASRTPESAASYAARYNFKRSYPSYASLLSDPEIDFVYISLPNALHYEWAAKALEAGKHVLLEKPMTSNALEAAKLFQIAEEKGKILMEAFHWQFHPAAHRFREILEKGDLGRVLRTEARMTSTPAIPASDIRWKYELGGGSLMDMGYTVSFTRFALKAGVPDEVVHAKAVASFADARVDSAMHATLRFGSKEKKKGMGEEGVVSTIYTDMARPWLYGIIPRFWEAPAIWVETENAEVYFYNPMLPHVYHYIGITDKKTGKTTYEKCYQGGPLWKERGENYWSTYRYQLEAFVDKVRGREPVWWIGKEESLSEMKTVDEIYQASGLGLRSTSTHAL